MSDSPDVTTEVKTTATRISGVSVNSPEGQQWLYLAMIVMCLVVLYPDVKQQCAALFNMALGALFAKSKT
jgi:hypothetical protein